MLKLLNHHHQLLMMLLIVKSCVKTAENGICLADNVNWTLSVEQPSTLIMTRSNSEVDRQVVHFIFRVVLNPSGIHALLCTINGVISTDAYDNVINIAI